MKKLLIGAAALAAMLNPASATQVVKQDAACGPNEVKWYVVVKFQNGGFERAFVCAPPDASKTTDGLLSIERAMSRALNPAAIVNLLPLTR